MFDKSKQYTDQKRRKLPIEWYQKFLSTTATMKKYRGRDLCPYFCILRYLNLIFESSIILNSINIQMFPIKFSLAMDKGFLMHILIRYKQRLMYRICFQEYLIFI
jgi:hypothetical protein